MYDTKERRWLIEVVLRGLVEDCLETLEWYPANSDGEFSEPQWTRMVENLLDDMVEEQPEQIFKFVKEYIWEEKTQW